MKQSFFKILCVVMTIYLWKIWWDSKDSNQIEDLMEFSGYYQRIHNDGFFVIDTVADFTFGKPTNKIFLLVNLNPKQLNTTQYEFTGNGGSGGSFWKKKGHLVFPEGREPIFNLRLTHDVTDETETVARIRSGSIKLPGKPPEDVTDYTTIFNPIKYSLFSGTYSQSIFPLGPYQSDDRRRDEYSSQYIEIKGNSSAGFIDYLNITHGSFSYNYISQKFQFETLEHRRLRTYELFMSIQGFSLAILVLSHNTTNITTFQGFYSNHQYSSPIKKSSLNSSQSEELAKYSGLYELQKNSESLFVVGQVNETNNWEVQFALCSTTNPNETPCPPYIFDSSSTFEHNRLTNNLVNITFTRAFNDAESDSKGSLVQFNGFEDEGSQQINGYSFFNPRSLASISGSEYKIDSSSNGNIILKINSENQIMFNDKPLSKFVYVPINGTLIFPPISKDSSPTTFLIFRYDSNRIRGGSSKGIMCFYIYDIFGDIPTTLELFQFW